MTTINEKKEMFNQGKKRHKEIAIKELHSAKRTLQNYAKEISDMVDDIKNGEVKPGAIGLTTIIQNVGANFPRGILNAIGSLHEMQAIQLAIDVMEEK